MRPFHVAALLMAALGILGGPATASTIPSLDFRQGQTTIALGLADMSLDYALTDRLSFGLSSAYVLPAYLLMVPGATGAGRTTYKLTRLYNLDVGVMLSAGYGAFRFPGANFASESAGWWWQPAINVALVNRPPYERWTPRVTLGPVLWFGRLPEAFNAWLPLPNLELGYRLDRNNEVTLGGNSLIGWRGSF